VQVIKQACEWWNKRQKTIIGSAITVLDVVEKGLEGLPISRVPRTLLAKVKSTLEAMQVC
jgi:hypothetical protein